MRFVVVTGMSGGGKRTALKLLEDAGFYCVDNLPVSLVEKFVELIAMPGSEISKVALGLDVRADQNFMDATRILEQLKEKGYKFEILFMDSDDAALIKRYKETCAPSCSRRQSGGRHSQGAEDSGDNPQKFRLRHRYLQSVSQRTEGRVGSYFCTERRIQ